MTREEFLAVASSKYDSIRDLNKLDNFYDYEKELVDIETVARLKLFIIKGFENTFSLKNG